MLPAHLLSPSQNALVEASVPVDDDVLQLPELAGKAMWRGNELGSSAQRDVVATGFDALDAELPGGGWPCRSLTEILQPQPALCEWRLLGASLKRIVADGGQIILVSPPKHPHLPGLMQHGLHPNQIVWLDAKTPAERLWTTEQLIKSNPAGAILSWLPQARQEQLRRLQVHAQTCDSPVFLFRPAAAQFDASPAPLRLLVDLGPDWQLAVKVFKRRGPSHEHSLAFFSIPDSLADVLTPRQRQPSQFPVALENPRVGTLGSSTHTVAEHQYAH
ncbi:protein ImuA [Polaromonas sp. OV174]|nr:protein ImuA [Polaromonas sp. OV174]